MAPTTVLITGANRGLGLGLLTRFLAQPDRIVIAAVRNAEHATARELAELPKAANSQLIVVKYDAGIEQDPFSVVQELQVQHGVNHLDVVIANAGISRGYPLMKEAKREDALQHIQINALSVVSLYQAARDLLERSTQKPVFAIMGSGSGALGRQPPVPNGVYGPSKSLVNWYAVRINAEDEWLNTFVLDPGWVQTEMGNAAAQGWGLEAAPNTLDESCEGMFKVVTTGTKEEYGGKVVLYDGEVQAW